MGSEFLYDVGQGWIYAASLVLMVGAGEIGRRIGMRAHGRGHPALGTIESASLGLLALMIGFTFSMALNRYDGRKAAVLDEANAIGTTLLRAQLLPAAEAGNSADLLAQYARTRLALGTAGADAKAAKRRLPARSTCRSACGRTPSRPVRPTRARRRSGSMSRR